MEPAKGNEQEPGKSSGRKRKTDKYYKEEKPKEGAPSPYYDIFYIDPEGKIENEAEWKRLTKMVESGMADSHIAAAYGISLRTFDGWKRKHRRFAQVLEETKRRFDDGMVVRSLFESATGYSVIEQKPIVIRNKIQIAEYEKNILPTFNAMQLWLVNRDPDRWKAASQVLPSGTPIEPNTPFDLSKASEEDLKMLEHLINKLGKKEETKE
jgi:hypothetical protein